MTKGRVSSVLVMASLWATWSMGGDPEGCDLGKLTPGVPGTGDDFGHRVAISDDTLAIGSWLDDEPTNSGSVTVYRYVRGVWTLEAMIKSPTPAANDRFGAGLALEGDVLVVGAPEDDDFGSNAGTAFVFRRDEGDWNFDAKLKEPSPGAADQFGWSAGVNGETIVIGSRLDDDGAVNTGSITVFVQNELGAWVVQQKFKGNETAASDQFGYSVGISGDTIIVGAFNDDDGGLDSGAAFLFTRSNGVWSQQAVLAPASLEAMDNFGAAVAIDGDLVVVGAPLDDDTSSDGGSASVFHRVGSTWTLKAKLVPSPGDLSERFGTSVATREGTVIVGAPGDDAAAGQSGSIRRYEGTNDVWSLQTTFAAFDAGRNDNLGSACGIDGDLIAGGAEKALVGGFASGSAYLFVATATDCNGNGTVDWCDVVFSGDEDCNSNGVPDTCEVMPPFADLNLDCFVNGADLGIMLAEWGTCGGCLSDLNDDGEVSGADLGLLLADWQD